MSTKKLGVKRLPRGYKEGWVMVPIYVQMYEQDGQKIVGLSEQPLNSELTEEVNRGNFLDTYPTQDHDVGGSATKK